MFELTLIVSRVLNFAVGVLLLAYGAYRMRAFRGTRAHRAGFTMILLGAGMLLGFVDRIAPNFPTPRFSIFLWLSVASLTWGCVRFIRQVRTSEQSEPRRHPGVR